LGNLKSSINFDVINFLNKSDENIIMGVFHLCGLGKFPGAVSVPLTYIYLALEASLQENRFALDFFRASGENREEIKGAPQILIIFTSREVINGVKNVWNDQIPVTDNWFQTRKKQNAPETLIKYFQNLFTYMEKGGSIIPSKKKLENLYFVEVEFQNFDDCFKKIAITMNSLIGKEIWINMIGGSNQINISLLSAGSYFAAARYYYIFQDNISLLHPEGNKPKIENLNNFIQIFSEKWQELPFFQLDIGKIVIELYNLFSNRKYINISEVRQILRAEGLDPMKYLPKMRGRLIEIDRDKVEKKKFLDYLANIKNNIKKLGIEDFSQWKKWGSEQGILHDFSDKINS